MIRQKTKHLRGGAKNSSSRSLAKIRKQKWQTRKHIVNRTFSSSKKAGLNISARFLCFFTFLTTKLDDCDHSEYCLPYLPNVDIFRKKTKDLRFSQSSNYSMSIHQIPGYLYGSLSVALIIPISRTREEGKETLSSDRISWISPVLFSSM